MTVHARKALRELSIPGALIAGEPPEVRGSGRDDVRLMLATPDGIRHTRFNALPELLRAGDLLVVNTSATLPAAFDGARDSGGDVTVHHGGVLADGTWIVELRSRDGSTGIRDGLAGERIRLATGTLTLISPHNESPGRLWTARADLPLGRQAWLSRHGRPVAYGHMPQRWPLSAYQSVFSRAPGSACTCGAASAR